MRKFSKKARRMIASLCVFGMTVTAFMTAAPLEALAKEFSDEDLGVDQILNPGDVICGSASSGPPVWEVMLLGCNGLTNAGGAAGLELGQPYTLGGYNCGNPKHKFVYWVYQKKDETNCYYLKAFCESISDPAKPTDQENPDGSGDQQDSSAGQTEHSEQGDTAEQGGAKAPNRFS